MTTVFIRLDFLYHSIFSQELWYYSAFDEYHVKQNLSDMEKLCAGYINERLDMYLAMLQDELNT